MAIFNNNFSGLLLKIPELPTLNIFIQADVIKFFEFFLINMIPFLFKTRHI